MKFYVYEVEEWSQWRQFRYEVEAKDAEEAIDNYPDYDPLDCGNYGDEETTNLRGVVARPATDDPQDGVAWNDAANNMSGLA